MNDKALRALMSSLVELQRAGNVAKVNELVAIRKELEVHRVLLHKLVKGK